MKAYGDISEEHRLLVRDLEEMELFFNELRPTIPPESAAKGLCAMAHDYYNPLFMDEEGERLLRLARKICPNYFKNVIHHHMKKDKDFNLLVTQLVSVEAAWEVMVKLGYED